MKPLLKLAALALLLLGIPAPASAQHARHAKPAAHKTVAPRKAVDWLAVVVKTSDGGYRQGNPNAKIKLVEYGSRTCPTCAAFANTGVDPLRTRYVATGKVSYEFRDYMVHGLPDLGPALLNQCVPTRDFFKVLDALYANQPGFVGNFQQKAQASPQDVQALLQASPIVAAPGLAETFGYVDFMKQQFGLAPAAAHRCLTDAKRIAAIQAVHDRAANQLGVHGTPSFFINGQAVPDAYSWEMLEPALIAAGA